MFRQVFSKFFRNETNNNANGLRASEQYNGQAQIYAIPTISSGFEAKQQQRDKNQSSDQNRTNSISMSSSSSNISKPDTYAKFDENNTRQIYIAPHCIRYSNSTLDETIYRIDDDSLNEIAAEILESDNAAPKLQIVFYKSNYYAINNSNLQVYKQLQLSGLITHVQADLISVEAIPYHLREYLLQTPSYLMNNFSQEFTDEECQDQNEDELSSSSRSQRTNGSSACSGEHPSIDIEQEMCSHENCDCAPDIVYAEDIFEDQNIFVDEIYEFGTCENCVESGGEQDMDETEDLRVDVGLVDKPSRYSDCSDGERVLNKLCEDTTKKLRIHLKTRRDNQPETDLNEAVKSALSNEIVEMKNDENMKDPRFKEAASGHVSDGFTLLKLDVKQKELNDQLFGQKPFISEEEKKKFISKQMSKLKASKSNIVKKIEASKEIQSLLVDEPED